MKWFNHERLTYTFTFPVETMALLTDGADDFMDKEYADFTAEMWSEGHSFFCYLSDSPDSLSSCCFRKNQKVLWKSSTSGVNLTTLEELHNLMPGNPKWMDGARSGAIIPLVLFRMANVKWIIPSDLNLINGVINDL